MRLIPFVFIGLTWSAAGHAVNSYQVLEQQRVVVTGAVRWGMPEIEKGSSALVAMVTFDVPPGQIAQVNGAGSFFKPEWAKDGKIKVGVGALQSNLEIVYNGGRVLRRRVVLQLDRTVIKAVGCKPAGLNLVSAKLPKDPIFIGARCVRLSDRVLLNLSVPAEVEWDSTSIFESAGKGDRWKSYELSRANLSGEKDVVATFNLKRGGEAFTLSLKQSSIGGKVAKQLPPKPSFVRVQLGAGFAQLSGKTPLYNKSGIGPLVSAQVQTRRPIWWKLHALGEIQFVVPMSGAQFYLFAGGIGPAFKLGASTSVIAAAEYAGVGEDVNIDKARAISIRANSAGVVLFLKNTGLKSEITAQLRYGVSTDVTAMGLNIGYLRARANKAFWGGMLTYQSQSGKATTGTAAFGQMMLAGVYRF